MTPIPSGTLVEHCTPPAKSRNAFQSTGPQTCLRREAVYWQLGRVMVIGAL